MDAWRQDARWGSGAAVALVAAGSGLAAHLSLRADSTGPAPALSALVSGGVLFALVLWPLAARSTRVSTLAAVLLLAQFGAHALTLLAAGAPVTDPRGLICCPPTEGADSGVVGRLTAQAGWTLVAVQALMCMLLAAVIRGSRDGADLVAFAFALTAAVLTAPVRGAGRMLRWLRALAVVFTPAEPPAAPPAASPRLVDPGATLARRSSRRGPPHPLAFLRASAASRPAVSLAAG